MDRLDTLLETAGPLLRRVDDVLAAGGAPPDHRVWGELRRVRLLPGDAAYAIAALRPAEFAGAVPELRADARAYGRIAASLPPPTTWSGDAAAAYEAARSRTAGHLSGGEDSLDERLEATADLADALIDWMSRSRDDLAATLAEILTSSEALTLAAEAATNPPGPRDIQAAAGVAVRVLHAVADAYHRAEDLLHSTADLTVTMPV